MSKKRKVSTSSPVIKVEVKEENVYEDDVQVARGRLKGALQELIEQSEDESASSDEDNRKHRYRSPRKKESNDASRYYARVKRRRSDTSPATAAYHHTYVMKLFDRSVDLARFEEDTPLYPICRAWMANQPRNAQPIVKRRASTPEGSAAGDEYDTDGGGAPWSSDRTIREVHRLPPPRDTTCGRVPSPLPEQLEKNKEDLELDYEEHPPVPRDELIRNHLQRWARVKQRWIEQANKNEERFDPSLQILTAIYNKAQENME